MQIPAQREARWPDRRVIITRVVVIPPPLLVAAADKAQLVFLQRQLHAIILLPRQRAAFEAQPRVAAQFLFERKFLHATGHAFAQPLLLAEGTTISAHAHRANRRHGRETKRGRVGRRRPRRALLDPRAQQSHLLACQRLALAHRRHLEVGHQPRDVAQQRTLRTAPRHDGHAVLTAAQRRRAGVEAEAALRSLAPVATHARLREDRLDVARELDRGRRCGRQLRVARRQPGALRHQARQREPPKPGDPAKPWAIDEFVEHFQCARTRRRAAASVAENAIDVGTMHRRVTPGRPTRRPAHEIGVIR